jgi:hypothetical protein
MDADGDFVVAWQSGNQDSASSPGIFARRFSSSGVAQASEFQVNSYTPLNQIYPSVGADLDGDFVVVWQDRYHDGSGQYGVFARRFSSAGTGLATEFQVNTYTINSQNNAAVAVAPGGDFVVVWESVYQYGPGRSVFAQRFSSVGTPAGVEFRINFGSEAAVGIDSEGDFVIAWDRSSPNEVLGRRFSSAGTSLSTEFQANTYDTGTQSYSSIAVQADEHFVIAWQDGGRDGSDLGIFAQRFKGPATLDIDGNGVLQPLSDGLLVLRKLFGFTGATLIGGAVGNGCTRCDATAIEAYINGLGLVLDLDGNTTLGALTDGLLVLRYLFGFTGGTLTTGAVGGGCSRCDAATIEPYLQGLV